MPLQERTAVGFSVREEHNGGAKENKKGVLSVSRNLKRPGFGSHFHGRQDS